MLHNTVHLAFTALYLSSCFSHHGCSVSNLSSTLMLLQRVTQLRTICNGSHSQNTTPVWALRSTCTYIRIEIYMYICYSGEERMAAEMSVSTGSPCMHMNWYLYFESHHPTYVKRGMVHYRVRGIISTQDNLLKKVDHLARALKQNSNLVNFIHNTSAPLTQK